MKPGYLYLAQTGKRPNHYRFAHTEDATILKAKKDKNGLPVRAVFPVRDMWGVEAFLCGYFNEKFVKLNHFALSRADVARVKRLTGQTIDQVSGQLLRPEEVTCPTTEF